MTLRRKATISFLFLFLLSGNVAFAGFGITPPYVRNDSLTKDSEYDQKIILTRSDPVEDLKAVITVNVPGADSWISVDKGKEFILPRGEMQVPMVVKVKVPPKAKYGEYRGNIRVVIEAANNPTPGTVGISLGAQIDVGLTVIDQKIYDFAVRTQRVTDLEEGRRFFGLFFPGKIKLTMQVENLGNISFGPTRVVMDIRDATGAIVETTENVNWIKKVKPFEIKEVTAELPTRLPPGSYKAHFKIYKNDEVAKEGELSLSILPYGTLEGYRGFYFFGLRRSEQALVVVIFLLILATLITGTIYLRRRFRPRRLAHPPRYPG
jgi:hypothetical protein